MFGTAAGLVVFDTAVWPEWCLTPPPGWGVLGTTAGQGEVNKNSVPAGVLCWQEVDNSRSRKSQVSYQHLNKSSCASIC